MQSLSQITQETRVFLKWGGIFLASVFLLFILFQGFFFLRNTFFPPEAPPPTVAFGKLPRISFGTPSSEGPFSYRIETLSGELPVFPDRAKAFEIISVKPDLLASQRAEERVSGLGFLNPVAISESRYQWSENESPSRVLTLDIFSYDFALSSAYLSDESVLSGNSLPSEEAAKEVVKTFLSQLEALPSDLSEEKTFTSLFTITGGTLSPATSFSQARVIRVDLFQNDIEELPVFYPHPPHSTMNFLVAGGKREGQVVEASFSHKEIKKDTGETYPLKTSQEAFSELEKGEGFIASYFGEEEEISIRNVFLAYFVSESPQTHLLPIVVFEGDDGFYAYISAIKNDWIEG